MGANDAGTLAPAGTRLEMADVWFDGNIRFRPGGAAVFENGLTTPPSANAPATPATGSVQYTNSNGQVVNVSSTGLATTVGGTIASVTSTTTVANTAALTALQSTTIPANDPATGATYTVRGFGVYSDTGTPTLTFALYWGGVGGTAIASIPAITLGSSITNVPFSYTAVVNFRSATSCWASLTLNLGTSATTDAVSSFTNTTTTATTVTTNVASALAVGVTWSAASASNTISLTGGLVERVA